MTLSNDELWNVLDSLIPGGCHTYSKGRDVFPFNAPAVLARGLGSKVWDNAGKRYLDFGMGLKSVVLGYGNKQVGRAAHRAAMLGNNLSRPSHTEMLAAQTLIELVPSIEMVKFAKNGSNVTTAALKLARVYTGRNYIGVPAEQPFFSFDDWFIGKTKADSGIPREHSKFTFRFKYGDIPDIKRYFDRLRGKIAAIILEPAVDLLPCDLSHESTLCSLQHQIDSTARYLRALKKLCEANGTLLIFDEMRTGFRWALNGAQSLFQCTPNLTTFGKAMANGYSLSALGGERAIMEIASTKAIGTKRTFLLSSTHGAEMSSLGAFIETTKIMKKEDVVKYLWQFGQEMCKSLNGIFEASSISGQIKFVGPPISLDLTFEPRENIDSAILKTLFFELLADQKILMPSISPSNAHTQKDLNLTYTAIEAVIEKIEKIPPSHWKHAIRGHLLQPVFRKYN
jgi:glutamate-1-semialdehyde 2,1-aminomutase